MDEVWLVGQVQNFDTNAWHLGGIYTTKEKAIQNCLTENDFVALVKINEPATLETVYYDKAWYPLLEEEPNDD